MSELLLKVREVMAVVVELSCPLGIGLLLPECVGDRSSGGISERSSRALIATLARSLWRHLLAASRQSL